MFFVVGSAIVVTCVLGGYAALGGKLAVLWQPFEVMIIVGAGLGSYLTANRQAVLVRTLHALKSLVRGERHDKEAFLELLGLLYSVFRQAKLRGELSLEPHIENPDESPLFKSFPTFHADKPAVTLLCDYLRLLSLGTNNANQVEALMDEEIETYHAEHQAVVSALQSLADSLPALGIVAAVLGIIKTMAAISQPPEVLGGLIGGALVGTFFGVFLSYGFVGPIAASVKARNAVEMRYFLCIKAGILAYMQGYAPAVAVEFARKAITTDVRPTFYEVEAAVGALPPVAA